MLDTKCLIRDLEDLCSYDIHRRPKCIQDAIKVCRMWDALEHMCEKHAISDDIKKGIIYLVSHIENTFFPHPIIHQTLRVAVQGNSDRDLHRIRDTIECIKGVNEVRL